MRLVATLASGAKGTHASGQQHGREDCDPLRIRTGLGQDRLRGLRRRRDQGEREVNIQVDLALRHANGLSGRRGLVTGRNLDRHGVGAGEGVPRSGSDHRSRSSYAQPRCRKHRGSRSRRELRARHCQRRCGPDRSTRGRRSLPA